MLERSNREKSVGFICFHYTCAVKNLIIIDRRDCQEFHVMLMFPSGKSCAGNLRAADFDKCEIGVGKKKKKNFTYFSCQKILFHFYSFKSYFSLFKQWANVNDLSLLAEDLVRGKTANVAPEDVRKSAAAQLSFPEVTQAAGACARPNCLVSHCEHSSNAEVTRREKFPIFIWTTVYISEYIHIHLSLWRYWCQMWWRVIFNMSYCSCFTHHLWTLTFRA